MKKISKSSNASNNNNHYQMNEEEDRISALPDAIIFHIFSFLDMRDVVHTSILSSRWRYLWLHSQTLNFSDDCKSGDGLTCFIDQVLNHTGSSNIFKFKLYLSCDSKTEFNTGCLGNWIIAALRRKIQHLDLQFEVDRNIFTEPVNLPDNLFTSSVKTLKLESSWELEISLPPSLCNSKTIKSLELSYVDLPDGNDNKELVLSCPHLEILKISNCFVGHLSVFSISTPMLGSLELGSLYTDGKVNFSKVKTCAPNLKFFKVSACENEDIVGYSLENVPCLVSACVDICLSERGDNLKEECARSLVHVLTAVSNMQALKLSVSSLQLLTDIPKLLKCLPDRYHNLKDMRLTYSYKAPSIDALLNFLRRCPHLETLVCERTLVWSRAERHGEDWGATKGEDLVSKGMFSCLKTFEIWNFQGGDNEVKFLELLLDMAVVLNKVVIKTAKQCLLVENPRQLKKKLLSLPRASSSASIHLI